MSSQLVTLAALEAEHKRDGLAFRDRAIAMLFPSAVLGTAKAARGDPPFRAPQRWACLAGLRAAGLLAMKTEVSVAFLIAERIGVKDPAEAERLISAASRARGSSGEDAYRLAKQLVRERIKADPVERLASMQEIYGITEIPNAVYALGSPNGSGGDSEHQPATKNRNGLIPGPYVSNGE